MFRIESDRARFREIVRGKIREDLRKYLSTTELIENPGSFPDTMFSEGLVTEANRTAGA